MPDACRALLRVFNTVALRRVAARNRDFALELAAAEVRERQQLARDLHDDLGQVLAAVQIRLADLCRHPDPAVMQTAHGLVDLVRRADRSIRSLAEQIAPSALHDLGLLPALSWLADDLEQQFRLKVRISEDDHPKLLAPEAQSIVYRAVRELLINVAKHANCAVADVDLRCDDSKTLRVTVRDQGRGFDVVAVGVRREGHGAGLRIVRDRLSILAATLDLRSMPGRGAEAVLRVPLSPSRGADNPQ